MRRVSDTHIWRDLERLAVCRAETRRERVSDRQLHGDPSRQSMPGTFRFDGTPGYPGLGDESYMAHSPLLTCSLSDETWTLVLASKRLTGELPFDPTEPFGPLARVAALLRAPEDPPFAGVIAGYVTYEFGERLLGLTPRTRTGPDALFFVHDRIARRVSGGWEITCAGLRTDPDLDLDIAGWAKGLSAGGEPDHAPTSRHLVTARADTRDRPPVLGFAPRARRRDTGTPGVRVLSDSLPEPAYKAALARLKRYIAAGDVYQANLTHMLTLAVDLQPQHYYAALRASHPGPFSSYVMEPGGAAVVGISPELFLRVDGRRIRTQPIKGTRPRGASVLDDVAQRNALLESDKDSAELLMIVDLMRNDLGRVARFASVTVPEVKRIDAHPSLYHLSGVIEAELDDDASVWDLLAASLPAGSITGAPKRRAVEILKELEPHARGVYTGAVGMVDFSGNMIMNVAIRTIRLIGDRGYLGVGGGIVADSDPDAEWQETLTKARAFFLGDAPEAPSTPAAPSPASAPGTSPVPDHASEPGEDDR